MPRRDVVPSGRLVVEIPPGLPDRAHLVYTLQALLGRTGLDLSFRDAPAEGDALRLSWPERTAAGAVQVDLARLRDAFEIISGGREARAERDHLGRVATNVLGADCFRPVLSEWAGELAGALAERNPAWRRPQPSRTVYLTHDVDRVCPLEPMSLMGKAGRAVRGLCHGTVRPARDLVRWVAGAPVFLSTYETIMRMERDAGAVATYYFMSGPYSLRRYGSRGGTSTRLRRLVEMAGSFGHRVGLHGCVYSLNDASYESQRKRLSRMAGRDITWHRNHYLVWDPARSPRALAQAGIEVDSTCAVHLANGFRAGLAWPYELWDLRADAPAGVMEIPLIFMDVLGGVDNKQTWAELYELLDKTAAVGGAVAVLFHAEWFRRNERAMAAYRELLSWLGSRGADLCGAPRAVGRSV